MNRLEEIWNKDLPTCRSCGWCPSFYEIKDELIKEEETETHEVYWAPCCSKDADDSWDHKGYYLYVEKT